MKTILILTDFTKNAANAAQSGVVMAKQMHANILLFNSNVSQPIAPVYVGGPIVIDEINIMEEENNRRLKQLADSIDPFLSQEGTSWKPIIHTLEGLGSIAYQIPGIEEEKNIEMIVMGAREGSKWEHLAGGSETFSVIDHATRPVLICPSGLELKDIKKVVFATDFSDNDIKAIHYLIKLGYLFHYHLEILHVNQLGEDDITKKIRQIEFMKHIHRLRYEQYDVTEVYGQDIIDRMNRFCDETNTSLLAFTHHRSSFFSGLFNKSVTKKALSKQKVPVLVFPAKFTD